MHYRKFFALCRQAHADRIGSDRIGSDRIGAAECFLLRCAALLCSVALRCAALHCHAIRFDSAARRRCPRCVLCCAVLWRSLGRPSPKSAPTETRKRTLTSALTNLLLTPDRAAHSAAIEKGACAQRATDEMHSGAFGSV
jgi:hypothetical protein